MRFSSFLAFLPLALATPMQIASPDDNGLSSLEPRQARARAPYCLPNKGVHMIVGSGAGAAQIRGYGLIQSTVESIRAAIPGSTNYSVPFDKTTDPASAPAAVAGGVALMKANIEWYAQGCPTTPIVLIGYSQGGMVIMNTLCGRSVANSLPYGTPLDSKYAQNIIATVTYGEETRAAAQSYNRGSCTSGAGFLPRANPSSCDAFANNIRSFCQLNDPRCCSGSPAPDPNVHFVYPSMFDRNVTWYTMAKYAERKYGLTNLPSPV